ncbi:transcriptional repressor [Taylorella asinigenitalis]|uniref:transcriptional repressor n=1 Tax=Taylorella asinigenitalis TaxID=84590 RepID=UPI00048CC4D0|nr:transcriptional repressor [Taylorella asinigenitalis]
MAAPKILTANIQDRIKQATEICNQRGLRLTPIRSQVLILLLQAARSLKAYELLDMMKAHHKSSQPATVYRALDFLVQEGFVHRVDTINGWVACNNFDHEDEESQDDISVIAVCSRCNKVQELDPTDISPFITSLLESAGFENRSPKTEIRSICSECRQKHIFF